MEEKKIQNLTAKLRSGELKQKKVFIGFDGFIDELLRVIKKRFDETSYTTISSMKEYGEKIIGSSGLSTNFEMISEQIKFGGNGPILANSMNQCGCQIVYAGAVGKKQIHPIFSSMKDMCQLIGVSDPAYTEAIEFDDGKLICSKLSNFNDIKWVSLVERIGFERLKKLILGSDMTGFENWTMILNMSDIWEHILSEILPGFEGKLKDRLLFVDLADPEKRNKEDIKNAIHILERFSKYFKVVLGLNKKEACEIGELYSYPKQNYLETDTAALLKFLKEKVAIDKLVIHPVDSAYLADGKMIWSVKGPYCRKPKLTTGAGDNFNAGYVVGELLGCTGEECLLLGTANSGFYVRNAKSADNFELADFLEKWSSGELKE